MLAIPKPTNSNTYAPRKTAKSGFPQANPRRRASVRGAVKIAKAHGLVEGAITTRCDEWLSRTMDCNDAVAELEADNDDPRED